MGDLVTGAMGKADRINVFALVFIRKVLQLSSSVKSLVEDDNAQHRVRTG